MIEQAGRAGQVVTAFIAAIEAGDIDGAVAMAAESISYENMPIDPIVGRDGLRATLGSFLGPASEVDWKILRQHEVGGAVLNERLDRFRIGDGWLELPVAGVFEVDDDGLITLWRDYFDMGSYQKQFAELTGR
ncbi:MAG: limonene-1,2-epoxide hydrolase family protein [Acidimicrobiales bacterium]